MKAKTFTNRTEWLEARKSRLGATDARAILGIGYASENAQTVFAEKAFGTTPERSPKDRELYELGLEAEEFILRIVHKREHIPVDRAPGPMIVEHPKWDFIGVSLDAFAVEQGEMRPVECKLVSPPMWRDWEGDDYNTEGLLKHVVQLQLQMRCTDSQFGYLAGWCGQAYRCFQIERNDTFLLSLESVLRHFWTTYILPKVQPPLDASDATRAALKALFPKDCGGVVYLPPEAGDCLDRLAEIKSICDMLNEEKALIEHRFMRALGENAWGRLPDGRAVSWKSQERKPYSVPAGSYRVLRTHKKAPKEVMFQIGEDAKVPRELFLLEGPPNNDVPNHCEVSE